MRRPSILIGQRSITGKDNKLDKLIQAKMEQVDRLNYEKYKGLFVDAANFLSKKKCLLYGGVAVNEMLPAKLKIYKPATLPDIDVLSPEPTNLAKQLVRYFTSKKHSAVSFTEALHKGTYKVFCEGIQLADITGVSAATYKRLLDGSKISSIGIKTVSPLFIRMTLHKMLAEPNDVHRWPNVHKRLSSFYKEYPIDFCDVSKLPTSTWNNDHEELVKTIYDVLDNTDAAFFGLRELSWILKKDLPHLTIPIIQVIVNSDAVQYAKALTENVAGLKMKTFAEDDFLGEHAWLYYKKMPMVAVYTPDNCYSYVNYKGVRVGSLNTIISFLLSMVLSSQSHLEKQRTTFQCMSDVLSDLQQNSTPKGRKLLSPFPTSCIGPSIGVVTMRRQRFQRVKKSKKSSSSSSPIVKFGL